MLLSRELRLANDTVERFIPLLSLWLGLSLCAAFAYASNVMTYEKRACPTRDFATCGYCSEGKVTSKFTVLEKLEVMTWEVFSVKIAMTFRKCLFYTGPFEFFVEWGWVEIYFRSWRSYSGPELECGGWKLVFSSENLCTGRINFLSFLDSFQQLLLTILYFKFI